MPNPNHLRRTALLLVLAGLVWNLAEAGVAFWAGAEAGSVALLAFGLDSVVDLLAGGVLVWRLWADRDEAWSEAAERRAQRLVGFSFFLLAAYIVIHSGTSLLGAPRAEAQPRRRHDRSRQHRRDGRPLRGQDAHRHADAVPLPARRGHGEPLLRPAGPLHPRRPGLNSLFAWWWADPSPPCSSSPSSSRKAGRTSPPIMTTTTATKPGSASAGVASTAYATAARLLPRLTGAAAATAT